jgi:hypothetical protein
MCGVLQGLWSLLRENRDGVTLFLGRLGVVM